MRVQGIGVLKHPKFQFIDQPLIWYQHDPRANYVASRWTLLWVQRLVNTMTELSLDVDRRNACQPPAARDPR
jgi:hypothetical protein